MRFPDWLFQLLPGDSGTQLLQVLWREVSSGAALTTVGLSVYQVPSDKALVLTNATIRFTPGAAQSVTRRRLIADPPAGNTRYDIFDDETDGAANQIVSNNWQGEVVVPGGWKVRVEGTFDAGAASNTAAAEIHGYLIPRGTFIF